MPSITTAQGSDAQQPDEQQPRTQHPEIQRSEPSARHPAQASLGDVGSASEYAFDERTDRVVILAAARTPIGTRRGLLGRISATDLGVAAARGALDRAGNVAEEHIGEVVFGNVIQAGAGQNIARQIGVHAGLPVSVPAVTINEVCGSSMKALDFAVQAIRLGRSEAILVGGTENMAAAPMLLAADDAHLQTQVARSGSGSGKTFDKSDAGIPTSVLRQSLQVDGLDDAFSGEPMGLTAEHVARLDHISRDDQDAYAARSQRLAAQAAAAGTFVDEIVPVTLPDGTTLDRDETIRTDTTIAGLAALKPAFPGGSTVTAGNSSSINVGASALVVSSQSFARQHDLPVLATVVDITEVGVDPGIMGIAPRDAIAALLRRNALTGSDIDRFEINEAFAATTLAVVRELGLPVERVNVNGGGIALGHPLGATGARLVTTLAYELSRSGGRYGIASLCVGGGMGLAVLLERTVAKSAQPDAQQRQRPFRALSPGQRRQRLIDEGSVTFAQARTFDADVPVTSDETISHLIENGIGRMVLPVGVVPGLVVDGRSHNVPLATEEPSVVAAASNGAKIVGRCGGFHATTLNRAMIGQVVIANPRDCDLARKLNAQTQALIDCANAAHPSIVRRGGGARSVHVRPIRRSSDAGSGSGDTFISLDVAVDVGDAMGANIVDTMMEAVAARLRSQFPEERVLLGILSNYATQSLTRVRCAVAFPQLVSSRGSHTATLDPRSADLAAERVAEGQRIAEGIALASSLAQADPYRAATHNKGIMNGIEAAVLATGNDTRAIEAACHAYAAHEGTYRGLSTWRIGGDGELLGEMTVPMPVATVGGGPASLPTAKAALAITGVSDAAELGTVVAALGLAQNLAALKALVTDGIQRGHMSLQARALAVAAGADGDEVDQVAAVLISAGAAHISAQSARNALNKVRSGR